MITLVLFKAKAKPFALSDGKKLVFSPILYVFYSYGLLLGYVGDHPFKTSACLRGVGVSPCGDGQKVTVHRDQKSPS